MRLVGPNGEQVGIVRVEDALRLAAESDLDLVEVAPMAKPPVAKLMDFGKFKYQEAIKEREARKNQVNTVIKEIKLRPKIDPHDYATKKGHVERFLKAGDKVKVTIMFRGREQSRPELGFRLLQRLAEDIGELGFVESTPKQDGRNMIMVIGPTKKKAEAKAEQRRKREEAGPGGAAPVKVAANTVDATPTVAETPVAVPEVVVPEVVVPEVVVPEVVVPEVAAPKAPVAKVAAPKAPVAKVAAPKKAAAKVAAPKKAAAKVAAPKKADTSAEAEVTAAD
ncbi:MAG TPA: translation initiation factor IF-3 [Dermatophilaceae bacterium]